MAQTLTRTSFHSSKLIRVLADLSVLDSAAPGAAFAEQVAQWVDFKHAIGLSSVHGAQAAAASPTPSDSGYATLNDAFVKARSGMERAIANAAAPGGRSRNPLPKPAQDATIDEARAYTPYRRYHQAQQREWELSVSSLRAKVRDGVAQAAPQLAQLVALDAAFDEILYEREVRLLATLPTLLERRYHHLYKAHAHSLADRQQADQVDQWCKPGGWLTGFHNELQTVLLAELDLRLQPAVGLLEALHNEPTQQHA